MKHYITGYHKIEGRRALKVELPIKLREIHEIMQWRQETDFVFDYLLDIAQVRAFEAACSLTLPDNLDFYLGTELD